MAHPIPTVKYCCDAGWSISGQCSWELKYAHIINSDGKLSIWCFFEKKGIENE